MRVVDPVRRERRRETENARLYVRHDPKPCLTCGAQALFHANGRPKKYCESCSSDRCACGNAKTFMSASCKSCRIVGLQLAERTCSFCEIRYRPVQSRRNIKFCSNECARAVRRLGKWSREMDRQADVVAASVAAEILRINQEMDELRPCIECGVQPRQKWKRTCSDECRDVRSVRNHARSRSTLDPDKRRAYRRKLRAEGKDHRHIRQRARRYGVAYESINPQHIFNRDGWRCGICRKAIKRGVQVPHPLSASLDHIVPLSKGGGHVRNNVQCAHFGCNSRKGNRSRGEQLLLVG